MIRHRRSSLYGQGIANFPDSYSLRSHITTTEIEIALYKCKRKRKKRAKRTTDEPRMIQISRQSPKYLLNNPHNHPRTSKSCRQNINFWLIHSRHSNVRNYISSNGNLPSNKLILFNFPPWEYNEIDVSSFNFAVFLRRKSDHYLAPCKVIRNPESR